MTDEQVATFLDLIELLEVKANQIVVKMNEPGDSMYFLLEGDVRVSQLIEEREILIAYLETGNFFGEMCVCDDMLRSADVVARELNLDPYAAAHVAEALRRQLVESRESFVFETVFSDPVGDKLNFLKEASATGYTVVLCFIGISGPEVSEHRVAMHVSQGGHDVTAEKLVARFPRTLANLKTANRDLPHMWIFDNDDLHTSFRHVAVFENGQRVTLNEPVPEWLTPLLA